ncbi:MAG: SHOCT domain-containing protein [Spirochaetaceae bacterium]|nr:SHOCT domain-containing protein [Spirochaetaceae bacterium]
MAYLAWKQNVGVENLNAEKAKDLLKNFRYRTFIDEKGKLRIDCGASYIKIAFEPNGNTTSVGVTSTPYKPWAFILCLVFVFIFVVPGFIFALITASQRKKIFIEAVQVMNQNASQSTKSVSDSSDVSVKITKLKELKEQGIINEEEFNKKRAELIEKL